MARISADKSRQMKETTNHTNHTNRTCRHSAPIQYSDDSCNSSCSWFLNSAFGCLSHPRFPRHPRLLARTVMPVSMATAAASPNNSFHGDGIETSRTAARSNSHALAPRRKEKHLCAFAPLRETLSFEFEFSRPAVRLFPEATFNSSPPNLPFCWPSADDTPEEVAIYGCQPLRLPLLGMCAGSLAPPSYFSRSSQRRMIVSTHGSTSSAVGTILVSVIRAS
jgi:hypothetical protein